MSNEELLTVEEVARELRINAKTVRQYIQTGELVAMTIGKGYRVSREDLESFKRARRTSPNKSDDKS